MSISWRIVKVVKLICGERAALSVYRIIARLEETWLQIRYAWE